MYKLRNPIFVTTVPDMHRILQHNFLFVRIFIQLCISNNKLKVYQLESPKLPNAELGKLDFNSHLSIVAYDKYISYLLLGLLNCWIGLSVILT